ncbi:MAG: histidine phosphatase family protein [Rickettsiales bacterium]
MKTLTLLRHAEAAPAAGRNDKRRPLTQRGANEARALGGALAESFSTDADATRVLCSDAVRTTQTAEKLTGQEIGRRLPLESDAALYNASAQKIFSVIATQDDGLRALAVVAHNPGISEACAALCDRLGKRGDERPSLPLAPATGMRFVFEVKSWRECVGAAPVSGAFVTPHKEAT